MSRAPTVLLLAGEPSGDQHGADVARELQRQIPNVTLVGTGGPHMQAAGVERFATLDDLAVMGFVEVLGSLGYFRDLERQVEQRIAAGGVDLVIPVDYPGFNMRVSALAKRLGVPVLFYIAPQVWAWRAHRAKRLGETANHIAVILPFEVPIFEGHGAEVTFVGHPLLDHPEEAPLEVLSGALDENRPLLALLPGSRKQEVSRHLALMLETARRVLAERPEVQIAIAEADGVDFGTLPEGVLRVRGGRALLRRATAALVKSGTSTLEAALAGVPFVCVYRTHPLTFALAKRLVKLDSIALANLVAGNAVVPEYVQEDFQPAVVAPVLLELLDPVGRRRSTMLAALEEVRGRLGTPGAAERVAQIAARLLDSGTP